MWYIKYNAFLFEWGLEWFWLLQFCKQILQYFYSTHFLARRQRWKECGLVRPFWSSQFMLTEIIRDKLILMRKSIFFKLILMRKSRLRILWSSVLKLFSENMREETHCFFSLILFDCPGLSLGVLGPGFCYFQVNFSEKSFAYRRSQHESIH